MDMRTEPIVERYLNKNIPNCYTVYEKKRYVCTKIKQIFLILMFKFINLF